jgi:hypothetical protein
MSVMIEGRHAEGVELPSLHFVERLLGASESSLKTNDTSSPIIAASRKLGRI